MNKLIYIYLIISPLIYITGGGKYSGGLNLASVLDLPSLSFINYIITAIFIMSSFIYYFKHTKYRVTILLFLLPSLLIMYRMDSIYNLMGIFLVIIPFFFLFPNMHTNFILTKEQWKNVFYIYIFYIAIAIISHNIILATGLHFPNYRMMGFFKNPNQLAFFCCIILILLLYYLDNKKILFKFFIISLLLYIILETGSRSGLLIFLLILLAYLYVKNGTKIFYYLAPVFLIFFIAVLSTIDINELMATIAKREVSDLNDAGNMRMKIFMEFIYHFSPMELLFGKGIGEGTIPVINLQANNNTHVVWTDSYMNSLFYSYGFSGLLLFYGVLFYYIYYNFQKRKKALYLALFMLGSTAFFTISEFFPFLIILILLKGSHVKKQAFVNHLYFK